MKKTKYPRVPLHGWVNLYKPYGMGSTEALGQLKRLLKPEKAGHGGTLDPLASGILPIALGEATKTVAYAMDARKTYRFTVTWGQARSTDDAEGDVLATSPTRPGPDQIRAALPAFVGEILQVPPRYSALKQNGQRAYDLARAGADFTLEARPVSIHRLELLSHDTDTASFEVESGKGMYVRSLARDIAVAVGTLGFVSALERTQVGPFGIEGAISLDRLAENGLEGKAFAGLLPVQTVLDDIPALAVSEQEALQLRRGQAVSFLARPALARLHAAQNAMKPGCQTLLAETHAGVAVAMVRVQGVDVVPERVFNL